jgi:uncharacterized protein YjbJ (UPF0337 family)
MGAKTDQVKGKAKEAAGRLAGDKNLESEGNADRRAGDVKARLARAENRAEEVVDQAKDALHPR